MITTLIVPGLDGSPAPHWQSWWAQSDPHALMVELSDPHLPVPSVWEVELASMILMHPDAILVAHSLGAVLVTRLARRWPHLRVRGALLVAPAETVGADRIAHFGPLPEAPLPFPAILAASRNDPWMGFGRAVELARAWGAELVDLGHAGHVNTAAGFGPWPGGRRLRDQLLARTAGAAPHPSGETAGPVFSGPIRARASAMPRALPMQAQRLTR